jgi:outer membrane protein TolC
MVTELRSEAREASSRLSSAHLRARQYQEIIVPAHRRVTAQTLLQYNAMQVGIFELLQARREELDAQLAHIETLREYWSATAAINTLLGGKRVQPDPRTSSASMSGSSETTKGH